MVARSRQPAAVSRQPEPLAPRPATHIETCIQVIRGQRVMLDADLAAFYGVATKRLNEQVRRNADRFPPDFAFQLTAEESADLRSQIATSSSTWGGRRYRPYAFAEHGAMMAAMVLKSDRAAQIAVLVVRAFVRLRQILVDHRDLARRIEALERQFAHKTTEHEEHIHRIYGILEELMNPPPAPKKTRIGFITDRA